MILILIRYFFLISLNVLCCILVHGQECTGQIKIHSINLTGYGSKDLNFLEPLIEKRNFFFVSEAHGNPYSYLAAKKIISYMATQNKLKWVAIEADYAHGCALNDYFRTGNLQGLKDFIKFQPDYLKYENIDYLTYYEHLRQSYDSLGFTFKFIGIDVCKEGFKGSVYSILNCLNLLEYRQFKDQISDGKKLLKKKKIRYKQIHKWVLEIQSKLLLIENSVESDGLRAEYNNLVNTIYNLNQSIQIRSTNQVNRELQIANNFKRYIDPNDYVYCQFGYGHVLTNRWSKLGDKGKSFVDWLQTTESYNNRSVIFAFSPHLKDSPEFPLFRGSLCKPFKEKILQYEFPVIVDFRKVESFNKEFQFVFIADK